MRRVAVTGAGGRTGSLVMQLLSERAGFTPVGLVRSAKSADKVKGLLGRAVQGGSPAMDSICTDGRVLNTVLTREELFAPLWPCLRAWTPR